MADLSGFALNLKKRLIAVLLKSCRSSDQKTRANSYCEN
ncbi:hypothetical protein LEP1GSC035_0805 [Leptospira noguchii str. 2007001578]|uniref:Uncharacterized protein n=2 Tax=Leptospira noguchii TaxID=28182 RepID=M6YPB8_9LEPT|nr:hypothetical protein LEP1GSC035_0805 [Leptospira noguchii str. 2007001578]EMO91434.1 hypothetical protein LEP1GSC024_2984 [Leptospira noguchii str. 2001034031]